MLYGKRMGVLTSERILNNERQLPETKQSPTGKFQTQDRNRWQRFGLWSLKVVFGLNLVDWDFSVGGVCFAGDFPKNTPKKIQDFVILSVNCINQRGT